MALTSFCGLLTIQVGAAILAGVFFSLAGAILAANIFDYNTQGFWFPFSLILMIFFVIGLFIAGAIMFASSYSESRTLAVMAVVVIVILICYWLILCSFSFLSNPDHVRGICIDTRCPETLWIGNLGYRRQHLEGDDEGKDKPADGGKDQPADGGKDQAADGGKDQAETMEKQVDGKGGEKKVDDGEKKVDGGEKKVDGAEKKNLLINVKGEKSNERGPKPVEDRKTKLKRDQEHFEIKDHVSDSVSNENGTNDSEIASLDYHKLVYPFAMKRVEKWKDEIVLKSGVNSTTDKNSGTEDDKPSRYVFGFPMIGAIILFIINLLFLLYSAFVMYSWAQELSWADYYDDDPVVVVEDY